MGSLIQLRKFTKEELFFDEQETLLILKFIFKDKQQLIEKLNVDDQLREFAQGLLLEAVDASYSLGFVDALFRATMNPGVQTKKVLTKFGRRAAKHWFKFASAEDLSQIKIYERVRDKLAMNFGRILIMYSNGVALKQLNHTAFISYAGHDHGTDTPWCWS